MLEFILQSQNFPFTVSLTIMLLIAVLEGVTTILGMGLSSIVDSFLPDFDVDMDMDVDADVDSPGITDTGILTKTFGWFRIGQVPFLIILIAFLTAFGLTGIIIQTILFKISGLILPGIAASAAALVITVPVVRLLTGIIARVMPKDETEAVAEKTFIGRVAVITLGTAVPGKPAQAKLKDEFGTSHYIMVEPDLASDTFHQGDQILIVMQTGNGFKGIRNETPALMES